MTHHTRVKICGITRLEDALLSEQLGVDALGFVFCEASKRFIEPAAAKSISNQLAPFIVRVGLFLDATEKEVSTALEMMPGLVPQFHGQETPAFCESFGVPYLKAIGLGGSELDKSSEQLLREYENAQAFLFDSNKPGQLGGTGHVFDWKKLGAKRVKPLILAGGLNAENVAAAIEQTQPYAVDVSSGVEQSKGIKDAAAMRRFVEVVEASNTSVMLPKAQQN